MRSTSKLIALILTAIFGWQGTLLAQTSGVSVLPADSLALVDLYLKTQGPKWVNSWDLKQPILTWSGVGLDQGGKRVVTLDLSDRNLRDTIPSSFDNLSELKSVDFSDNKLTHIENLGLFRNLKEFNVQSNRLTFDDLTPALDSLFGSQVKVSYADQDSVGFRRIIPAYEGETLVLVGRVDPGTRNSNEYNWYRDQVFNNQPSSGNRIYRQLVDSSGNVEGSYYYTIINRNFPDLILTSREQVVKFYPGENPFPEGPMSFVLTLSDEQLNDRAYYGKLKAALEGAGGSIADSCLCGTFEVWEFDSIKTPNGISIDPKTHGSGLGVIPPREDSTGKTRPGFDINYRMKFGDETIPGGKWVFDAGAITGLPNLQNPLNDVTVAVIDMGIEASHPAFGGRSAFYFDPSTDPLGMDQCYPDDPSGINLQDPGIKPFNDVSGHGTHVAGIIKSVLPKIPIKLMSIQVGDMPNTATVFKVACGIEYALRHEVEVINISMGYQGDRVSLLDSIMTTPKAKKTLFVTAAGNDGDSNDSHPHWPSNLAGELGNEHIMAVASFGKDAGTGDFYISLHSNYSQQMVNIAAPGENIYSPINKGLYGHKSGTSMSVGFVSAFAAALKASNPGLMPSDMAEVILTTNITVQEDDFLSKVRGGRRLNIDMIDCFTRPQAFADTADLSWTELSKELPVYANDCIGNTNIVPRVIVLPTSGSVTWNADSLSFRYAPNFLSWIMGAEDSFTYQLCPSTTNQNNCSEAIVSIHKQGIGIFGILILILLLLILIVWAVRRNSSNQNPA